MNNPSDDLQGLYENFEKSQENFDLQFQNFKQELSQQNQSMTFQIKTSMQSLSNNIQQQMQDTVNKNNQDKFENIKKIYDTNEILQLFEKINIGDIFNTSKGQNSIKIQYIIQNYAKKLIKKKELKNLIQKQEQLERQKKKQEIEKEQLQQKQQELQMRAEAQQKQLQLDRLQKEQLNLQKYQTPKKKQDEQIYVKKDELKTQVKIKCDDSIDNRQTKLKKYWNKRQFQNNNQSEIQSDDQTIQVKKRVQKREYIYICGCNHYKIFKNWESYYQHVNLFHKGDLPKKSTHKIDKNTVIDKSYHIKLLQKIYNKINNQKLFICGCENLKIFKKLRQFKTHQSNSKNEDAKDSSQNIQFLYDNIQKLKTDYELNDSSDEEDISDNENIVNNRNQTQIIKSKKTQQFQTQQITKNKAQSQQVNRNNQKKTQKRFKIIIQIFLLRIILKKTQNGKSRDNCSLRIIRFQRN